jgi:hypothetical protein
MSPCSQDSLRLSGRDPRAIFPGLYKGLPLWEGIFTLPYDFTTARGDVNAGCVETLLQRVGSQDHSAVVCSVTKQKSPIAGAGIAHSAFFRLPQCSNLPPLVPFVRSSSNLVISKPLYASHNACGGAQKVYSVLFRQMTQRIRPMPIEMLNCDTMASLEERSPYTYIRT